MRIVLVQVLAALPGIGGQHKVNRAILTELAARGHECCLISPLVTGMVAPDLIAIRNQLEDNGLPPRVIGNRIIRWKDRGVEVLGVAHPAELVNVLTATIRARQPTWVVVSCDDFTQSTLIAALLAAPQRVIALIGATMSLPFGPHNASPHTPDHYRRRRNAFAACAGILTMSRYLRDYVTTWAGLPATCLYPPVFSEPNRAPQPPADGAVMLVNPSTIKGLPLFLALARAFPGQAFRAVPTWATTTADRDSLAVLNNVTILEPTPDVDQLFSGCRVLVVPSFVAEGFGLTAIEAMLRGIPVLASDQGGLPEAKLGVPYILPVRPIQEYTHRRDGAMVPIPVVPDQNPQPWVETLDGLLRNQEHFEGLSRDSRRAATSFARDARIECFEDYLAQRLTSGR